MSAWDRLWKKKQDAKKKKEQQKKFYGLGDLGVTIPDLDDLFKQINQYDDVKTWTDAIAVKAGMATNSIWYAGNSGRLTNQHGTSIQVGSRVVLKEGVGSDSSENSNPIWGKDGNYIAGVVERIENNSYAFRKYILIRWDNGYQNLYEESTQWILTPLEKAVQQMPPKGKSVKLDSTKLDALVLKPSVKEEIVSVLKQHQNADKIFKEWGLGETIEYGKGMTFLFHGLPGTGKTWAATCIAKALGTTLLTVSAAEIQSSEPGGANRSIQNAFKEAREKHLVLFLDECDSLIQTRQDLGMILGSEVNTLLTEIEKTEGVVILATNQVARMDAALERRISLIIEFPMPTAMERLAIWMKLLPTKMPIKEDVSIETFADEHELTGGQIKNVILHAARLAVSSDSKEVAKDHFDSALSRMKESKGIMGTDSRYNQTGRQDMSVGGGVDKKKMTDFLRS